MKSGDTVYVQLLPGVQIGFELLPPDGGPPITPASTMRPHVKFKVETGGVYIVRAFVAQDGWRASDNRARYQIGFGV